MLLFKKYDVFISYAIEDKIPVAETIVSSLKQNGIKVWYVGSELKVGDAISTVIGSGLRNSRYCILILSPNYERHWTIVELYTFIQKEQLEKKILILPVWHNIDYREAREKHPIIADRYAISTKAGLESVSVNLCEVIRSKKKTDRRKAVKQVSVVLIFTIACLAAIYFSYRSMTPSSAFLPSKELVQNLIQKRTDNFQAKLDNDLQKKAVLQQEKKIPADTLIRVYKDFINSGKYERNEYKYNGDVLTATGFTNIKALGIFTSDNPYNGYGIASPACYLFEDTGSASPKYSFTLTNQAPVSFVIDTLYESGEKKVLVHVVYSQYIRAIQGTYIFSSGRHQPRKQSISITGFKPEEEYFLENRNGTWVLNGAK